MRRVAVLALSGLCACGDNLYGVGDPLAPAHDLVVVAHEDDDLLFMQPDVAEAATSGAGLTIVYVTAGNGRDGDYERANERYDGLKAAYGAATGDTAWHCGYISIHDHTAEHCRLADEQVSLVFLAYPDGGKMGELDTSLLHLWEGAIDSAETISYRPTRYDRDGLIDTVADIVRLTQPAIVRTLEIAATHGRDHSDHMLVGALTTVSLARANSHAEVLSYRGYNIESEPSNKAAGILDANLQIVSYYEACATGCAPCGERCDAIPDAHAFWLARRYANGLRRAVAGTLRSGADCLNADLTMGACESAPVWRFDDAGQLRAGAACLEVAPNGDLAMTSCYGGSARRFFLDDDGHVWSGMAPTPQPDMDLAHLWCLAPSPSGARLQLCGADDAPTWEVVPHAVETPRTEIGIVSTGREVRLGDLTGDGKADLCAVEFGLLCAPGDGAGGFGLAVRLDNVGAPLAIDPRSLMLGDVDGDGKLDACGRDDAGVLCSTAAKNFAAERWSPSFADALARPGTSASLAALDANADGVAEICGIEQDGVICAPYGLMLQPEVRSQWPSPSAVVWPADLDGDHRADWCAATDDGPACAVDAERDVTTDGAVWGYSQNGVVEVTPATTATVAVGDVDGDGRADLCSTREDHILCARSQGRGFGPRATLAILPNQSVAGALWLGDLDGDGRADACADTGQTVTCAVEP